MLNHDYERIAKAIALIEHDVHLQPTLTAMAQKIGLSPSHFQRLFRRWAGISPKRFVQCLSIEHAKACLDRSASVLEAAYDAGLSSGSRLHDLFVSVESMTPGQYVAAAQGLEIRYNVAPSPFGQCLVAQTDRGLCAVQFVDQGLDAALADLRRRFGNAHLQHDPHGAKGLVDALFALESQRRSSPIRLFLKGTNFQLKVWQALLRIPEGSLVSYGDVAKAVACPNAVRAVGSAVGENPIAYLIPCHRVLRKTGALGGYRSGLTRKRAMLGRELGLSESW